MKEVSQFMSVKLTGNEIETLLTRYKNKGDYTDDQIQIAKSDLEYGLSKSQVDSYMNRKYTLGQMKVYSNCLRGGFTDEQITKICRSGLDESAMRKAYEEELAANRKQEGGTCGESMLAVITQIKEELQSYKVHYQQCQDEKQKLYDEIAFKDKQLEEQQDILNDARSEIAKNKMQMKSMEEEIAVLKGKIKTGEEPEGKKPGDNKKEDEFEVHYIMQPEQDEKQEIVIDKSQVKKTNTMAMLAFSNAISIKKRNVKPDIASKLISAKLTPAQMIHIRSALEKGLSEKQIMQLIHKNISPERMKEIISIAVLEKQMANTTYQ